MKKPKLKKDASIAEILHYAADYELWRGDYCESGESFSCGAIYDACLFNQVPYQVSDNIFDGLSAMGLNPTSVTAFFEFEKGVERQAARYTWLKFAAMIAEEQGV